MSYTIDPVHSHVGFSIRHLMITTVRGKFSKFSGTANIDAADFTKSTFTGEVDVDSIDTGNAQRDGHVKSADFLDVAGHPKATFKSTGIAKKGEHYAVTGDLTLHGITKPITFEVEYSGTGKHPHSGPVAGFSAKGELSRKDFGITFNAPTETGGVMLSDKVKIAVDIQAVENK